MATLLSGKSLKHLKQIVLDCAAILIDTADVVSHFGANNHQKPICSVTKAHVNTANSD